MKLVTTSEAAVLLGLSVERVRVLCSEGRIEGAQLVGTGYRGTWVIPLGEDGLPRRKERAK